MDAIEAILTRRSIRKYTADPVSDETIALLLKTAMNAPTATNEAWSFVVIKDRATLAEFPRFHHHSQMLNTAAVGILVCGDPTIEELKGRWPLDCSAASENMLIAANALGLGACWVGIYPVEERITGVRKLLGIPAHVVPFSVISIGYPGEKKKPPDRFRPDRVHYERW